MEEHIRNFIEQVYEYLDGMSNFNEQEEALFEQAHRLLKYELHE